jgi:hypothetical protein
MISYEQNYLHIYIYIPLLFFSFNRKICLLYEYKYTECLFKIKLKIILFKMIINKTKYEAN